jgi:hypothetical protein
VQHSIPLQAIDLERLRLAEQGVAESECLVRRQRDLIAQFEPDGLAKDLAKILLSEFEKTLARQTADRDRFRARLGANPRPVE